MEWKDKYKRNVRPAYNELIDYLPENVRQLFLTFNQTMEYKYKVYNKYQRYVKTVGWVYGYCRNYRCELLCVTIGSGYFNVLGVKVDDETSLNEAFNKAKKVYDSGYEERYARLVTEKRANQVQRTKVRLMREAEELKKTTENIDPALFNRFNWRKKVSRSKLLLLYRYDAQGLPDENLLDDIGYTFYIRCKQAKEIREHLQKGRILCHHCGAVLTVQSTTSIISCPCGHYYTYREYRRSANANSLPGGRAKPIFDAFVDQWPMCKDVQAKMILIDWLIHECHVSIMSGLAGRSVCVNLIDGTAAQLRDMLEMLAAR